MPRLRSLQACSAASSSLAALSVSIVFCASSSGFEYWLSGLFMRRSPLRRSRSALLECHVVIGSDSIDDERRRFADTLETVGPDAPTNAGHWSAHEVAAHVVSLDRYAGIPTFIGRAIVGRGVRLNDVARRRPELAERAIEREKQRGFEETIASLRQPTSWLLGRRLVRAVGLFEVWAHHEDVRRPNGVPRDRHPDLADVITWLRGYSKVTTEPDGPPHDVAYWLAGRDGGPRPI